MLLKKIFLLGMIFNASLSAANPSISQTAKYSVSEKEYQVLGTQINPLFLSTGSNTGIVSTDKQIGVNNFHVLDDDDVPSDVVFCKYCSV